MSSTAGAKSGPDNQIAANYSTASPGDSFKRVRQPYVVRNVQTLRPAAAIDARLGERRLDGCFCVRSIGKQRVRQGLAASREDGVNQLRQCFSASDGRVIVAKA